ncbi:hypothetical protein Pfo_020016 [Paulownia fortunei]|nr:hypothetical protein Pfo_020016 [Paulownia fortunei]
MVMRKFRTLVLIVMAVGVLLTQKTSASFKDCYTKCFLSCMIDPSQTLCSCTTHCLKDCIFSEIPNGVHEDSDNLGFCELGCAFSTCSSISTRNKPNGDKVNNCVGSCSTKCTMSYSSP